jgi:zinc protease
MRTILLGILLLVSGSSHAQELRLQGQYFGVNAGGDQPLVALRFIVNAGSQYDPPGKEGLAYVTARLLSDGGTKDLTYDEVLKRLYPMAGGFSSRCLREYAVFSGVVHRDNLKPYCDLIGSMIAEPRLSADDFERIRNEALDYLTKTLRANDDEDLGKSVLQLAIYGEAHPYGHEPAGTVEGLKNITLDDVKSFHKSHYTANSIHRLVAGDKGRDYLPFEQTLESRLSKLEKDNASPPALPPVLAPEGLNVIIIQKPADSSAISIGFPVDVTRANDDFYPLYLANSFLGEHRTFNGRLMVRLRRDRGLNYGDYSYLEEFIQEGGGSLPIPNNARRQQFFSIWIRPVPHDKAAFALRAALYELDRLVEAGLTDSDFEVTRRFLLNYSTLWEQTLERRLGSAFEGFLYGVNKSLRESLQARLPATSRDQVNELVRKHLKPQGMYAVIVTQDAEGLKKQLESGEPSPLKYDTEGTPQAILEEDRKIERFALKGLKVRVVAASSLFEKRGLPVDTTPSTHTTATEADYYLDSPAQRRAPDGKLAADTKLVCLKEQGSYSRIRFRPDEGSEVIEAWVASDVLNANAH